MTFVDLGMSPLCESFVTADQLDQMEPYYPLHVQVCGTCFLVQLPELVRPEGRRADLVIGNNALAQVPDLNDFVAGMAHLLAPGGVITLEFPHLERLIEESQFDTIYHEHFSYFWLLTIERIAREHGLRLFDVEKLPTHGGSLRVYLTRADAVHRPTPGVAALLAHEREIGFDDVGSYARFGEKVHRVKRSLLSLLVQYKNAGARICGYGAPGKGNIVPIPEVHIVDPKEIGP